MNIPLNLLLIEDSPDDADLMGLLLTNGGYDISMRRVESGSELQMALKDANWDIIISDYSMYGFTGLEALSILKESKRDIPFILISGTAQDDIAVEAMREGASDFFQKSKLELLASAVRRELGQAEQRRKLKEADQLLQHANKMDVVGQLAGGIAHDFNNLLAVIGLSAEGMLKDILADHVCHGPVALILKAQERGAQLTSKLLSFSRKEMLEPRIISLNELLGGLKDMLRRVLSEDIDLVFELSEKLLFINVDPGQLELAVMNLVVNARDAILTSGTITIRTNLTIRQGQQIVELTVADTGSGMKDEIKSKVFEPFFTTKEFGRGTGLGLSTVYGVVEQSNGSVEVESVVGEGTVFRLFFASCEPDFARHGVLKGTTVRSVADATILLVEDEKELREIVAGMLARSGYKMIVASNGREALGILKNQTTPIDLIITDVVMPEMGGHELWERARTVQPKMRALYLSGYSRESLSKYGVSDSNTFFLEKPFKENALLDKIVQILTH